MKSIKFFFAGSILPFPNQGGILALEIILLFLLAALEGLRLFFGMFLLNVLCSNCFVCMTDLTMITSCIFLSNQTSNSL